MAAEFDCYECGRHIIAIAADLPPEPPLCAMCVYMPGWFKIPQLRAMVDPEHDGLEAWERAHP